MLQLQYYRLGHWPKRIRQGGKSLGFYARVRHMQFLFPYSLNSFSRTT